MRNSVKLTGLEYGDKGHKIKYHYTYDKAIAKYFNPKDSFFVSYEEDVLQVPLSIAVIPFLANFMPIAWFAGFDVFVDEVDETFKDSLENLKKEFQVYFPQIENESRLYVKKTVKNIFNKDNYALLFSGGLDAFESLTRNIEKKPFLISIHGADIEISDKKKWEDFKRFNIEESIISKDRMCYVTSNLRTFYTYEVDLLVGIGWWGKIQHGMALLSLIAPLSNLYGITTTLIGSSNTGEVSFGWGSTSETDELVKWANQKVIHDGFEFRRTEKIENIVNFAKKTNHKVKLRVCYSELRKGANCNRCAKCQRTIFGFLLCGENPNDYGFNVPNDFYDLLLKNFEKNAVMTIGVKYEWKCLQEKAAKIKHPFILLNEKAEMKKYNDFLNLNIEQLVNKNNDKAAFDINEFKFIISNKFPQLFKLYLTLRRKL